MDFLKKLSTAQIVTALVAAFVGFGAVDMGAAMLIGKEGVPLYEIALIVGGALGIAAAVLVLMDKTDGYIIAAIGGVLVLGLGIFRVAGSAPEVYLIDFLSIVFGAAESVCGFASFKNKSKQKP